MREKFLCVAVALAVSASAASVGESESAEKTVQLQEVTVKAVPVIRKADRDLYVPSEETRKISSDGLDLLGKMQIPTITVNPVLNTIDRAGDAVELRINGRKADVSQVRTLSPATIVRVEYHENPGVRYGGAAAVLDFIVKNRQSGGSLQSQAQQCLTNGFGNQWVNLKLNSGKSQFEGNYYGHMRLDLPMYRENRESYLFPDGNVLNRLESPIGGCHNTYDAMSYVAYNYVDADKTNFYASVYFNRQSSNLMSYDGVLTMSDGSRDVLIHDAQRQPGSTPGVNMYLDRKFKGGNTLVLDVNAGYYKGHSIRDYSETYVDDGLQVVDIDTRINDRNFALTATANYIKEWKTSKLTTGIGYVGRWNRSEYASFDNTISRQREDKATVFAEYQQRLGRRLNIAAGVVGDYNSTRMVDSGSQVNEFLLRPRFTASYRLNDVSQLRVAFNTYSGTPTLSQMSAISQDIDGLQTQVGNPGLEPYNTYNVTVRYNYSNKIVTGQISAFYQRSPNAIMDCHYWNENGMIVSTYANQSGATSWGVSISPRVTVVPQWVTLSGTLSFRRSYTRGADYRHCLGSVSGSGQLQVSHWGFSLTAMYQKGNKSLWGETVTEGETVNVVMLGYRWKGWSFDAGVMVPFGRYRQGSQTLNRYVKVSRTMRTKAVERMPILSVSYRIDWGRKIKPTVRLIDSESGVQQSSSAGK